MSRPDRRPTLDDVAARAGVSRALVSIVMRDVAGASDSTRARVRAVADDMGYRPDSRARLLAGRRTRLLGVTLSLRNPFHADVADGVYAAAERAGYEVVLSAVTSERRARAAVETLRSYRCEAMLLLGVPVRADALAELARSQPVVVIGQRSPHARVDAVRAADGEGVRLAVEHLTGLGHRRIAHLDGGRAPGAGARRAGYRAAMRRAGLASQIRIVPAGETEEAGAAAARRLAGGLPHAVLCYNDRSAVGVLDAFARSGVAVPAQVSVVGFDDTRLARLPYLRLTTVSQDTAQLAELAVQRAIDRLERHAVLERDVVLTPHLVVRGTTARRS